MQATIWHNARCSNSRGALQLLREAGIEPEVIHYLETPPDRATLATLLQEMGIAPRALLRTKEEAYSTLGLADDQLGDDALIDAMAAHPQLINRPIVRTPRGTRLCRPPELVHDLLA